MQKKNLALNEQSSQFMKRLKYINMINQPKQEYFNVVLSKISLVKNALQSEQQNNINQQIQQNTQIKQQNPQQIYQKQQIQAQNKMIPELNFQQEVNIFNEKANRDKKYLFPIETQQNNQVYQNNYQSIKKQNLFENYESSPRKIQQMEFNSNVFQQDLNKEDSFDQINAGYIEFNQNQNLDLRPRNLADQFMRHSKLEQVKKPEHIQLQKEILENKDQKLLQNQNKKIKQYVKTQQEQLEDIQNNQQTLPQNQQIQNGQNLFKNIVRQEGSQQNIKQNIIQQQNKEQQKYIQNNYKNLWNDLEIEILTEILGYLKIDTAQVDQFFQNLTEDYNRKAKQKGLLQRSHKEIFEKIKHDSFLIYKHEKQKEKKTYKHLIEKSLTSFI
ncbi:hypothetical protein TTHERM_00463460 (macronuclear) [Tetrahymena thermophila SB210]|uniref:Uncharacterized protein n=1 Tax=Tetrahymena thermophila (strain SB210) TaxID=312017 RepID=Q23PT7_TETTS|nr:hypothetical protein TTHERM_00463460 [Tetrahymena thermophila SB210]EAR98598.2 hypothetical protein TTHERM_00463460 [Tetrahymena thermophila SB210]|eukprot:XP_001018843.2 hypothetical protein TTHERM_00463460 [Tetrahymena thermophila SB210]